MKKGFSLLELIFAIVVIGIIASFAIPKYMDTKDSAVVSTLKRDISTATTSIQSHYLLNQNLEKISDAVTLNPTNWTISDLSITYKNIEDCATLEVKDSKLILTVTAGSGDICKKLDESGIKNTTYDLY